jgi:hypothetical protein
VTAILNQFSIQNLFTYDLTIISILVRFVAAAFLSGIISLIFNWLNQAKEGNYIMMHTLIFLAVAIAGAMMIIGNNLARAFGLVGAVSIIRFRSAVKSARDMAFVLFVIVIGMACGLGYILIAALTVVFGGLLMLLLWKIKFGQRAAHNREFELKISHFCNKCSRVNIELELTEIALSWTFIALKETEDTRNLTYQFCVDDYQKVEILTDRLRKMGKKDEIGVIITSIS